VVGRNILGKDRVGVCVIGLGIGLQHAQAYSGMEGVDLFVCDTNAARVENARRELKVAGAFATIDAALSSSSVDAVDVTLPNSLHGPIAMAAAKNKKDCLVEKPVAISVAEAGRMWDASQSEGVLLAAGENWQFSAFNLKAAEIIRSGQIGRVFLTSVLSEMWPIYFDRNSWWFDKKMTGGGVLLSAGVHAIRTLRMLAPSEITSVYALASNSALGTETEDTCVMTTQFADGSIGSIIASWATPHDDALFRVHGSKGSIINRREGGLSVRSNVPNSELETKVEVDQVNTITEECAAFVDSVRNGRVDKRIEFEGGRRDVEVAEAAYRSVATGQAVKLPLS
jgi:predicted dehydrogenase